MKRKVEIPMSTVRLWQVRVSFIGAVAVLVFLRFCFLTRWLWLPAGILLALTAGLVLWLIPKHLKSFDISLDDDSITVKKGFIIQATHILPAPRMVYATAFHSPVSLKLGLSGIILRASRGILVLPELEREDTELIISLIYLKEEQ